MLSHEDRLAAVIKHIESLKNTNKQLERERDLLHDQVTQLEKKVEDLSIKAESSVIAEQKAEQKEKQKRKEEVSEMSMSSVELKQEIDRHIEEIDECLGLLKTI